MFLQYTYGCQYIVAISLTSLPYFIFSEIDPCIRNPKVCHSEAKCVYNNGSFVCQCANGYIGNGKNNCTGIQNTVL